MTDDVANAERDVLLEALGASAERVTMLSREPFGSGSVTGFRVSDGRELTYYVDSSGIPLSTEQETPDDVPEVRIWLHPADPHLPALAPVAFEDAIDALLRRLGIASAGMPHFHAYRPGRRAVLSVPSEHGTLWVKVVRPVRVKSLVEAHAALSDADIPVPGIVGWSPEGLIVMHGAAGTPAGSRLGEPEILLDNVEELRQRLAGVSWTKAGRSVSARIDWYASRRIDTLREVLDRAGQLWQEHHSARAGVPIHGDLHFGQLFVDDRAQITGVIDVDTLGVANPAEDEGAFLSHAIASALLTDRSIRAHVWAFADHISERWGADAATRALAAVHLVGHAIAAVDRGNAAMHIALTDAARAVLNGAVPSSCDG